ncbi:MAG: metallophosphoesterase [Bacteroidales bacterium]|nr:metallophosphoesterase [Bacteroidales bacterium]
MLISVVVLSVAFALIPNFAWLLVWIVAKCFNNSIPYAPFGWTSLGLVLFAWIVIAYGYFAGRFKIDINEISYTHKDIPSAFDGYKIVHISDLHLSTFDDNHKKLEDFVEKINLHNPDLICFTGDLVSLGKEEAEPYTGIISKMKAKDGVASVLGNHDFMIYGSNRQNPNREKSVEELADFEKNALNWHLLRNENLVIERNNQKITILGVDNQNCSGQGFKTISRGDLGKAMQNTDGFRILLTHDPSHWDSEVVGKTDIPLTLCGHTHAAQIKIFGWTPAKWTFIHTHGLYTENNQTLYINIGLGCTLPIRLGANAEITVITLKSKQ